MEELLMNRLRPYNFSKMSLETILDAVTITAQAALARRGRAPSIRVLRKRIEAEVKTGKMPTTAQEMASRVASVIKVGL